jgi:hypothetical protein
MRFLWEKFEKISRGKNSKIKCLVEIFIENKLETGFYYILGWSNFGERNLTRKKSGSKILRGRKGKKF